MRTSVVPLLSLLFLWSSCVNEGPVVARTHKHKQAASHAHPQVAEYCADSAFGPYDVCAGDLNCEVDAAGACTRCRCDQRRRAKAAAAYPDIAQCAESQTVCLDTLTCAVDRDRNCKVCKCEVAIPKFQEGGTRPDPDRGF